MTDKKADMSDPIEESAAETRLSVVDKLKALKKAQEGEATFTLPATGVVATFPKFLSHGAWMRAQRLAKKDVHRAQTIYVVKACKFDGEKMTVDEFASLIPTGDALELLGQIFGGDDDDEDVDAAGKLH